MTRAALILAGGAGTRLRPLSSDENPKQFLPIFGGKSLIQLTWERLEPVIAPEHIFVSTTEQYATKCRAHLPQLRPENIIAEPARRNTAPAIALSCFAIESAIGPCTIACLPSDHHIANPREFVRILERAYEHAESSEDLVTIGIEPTEPHTGYGYLELGDEIAPGVIRLRRFMEKPSRERAEEFLRSGNFAWNGGMFIWRSDVFRRSLERAAPEIAGVRFDTYEAMPNISIDYALMEKAPNVATIRGEFGWSDVGSWEALRKSGATIPEGIGQS